MTKSATNNAAAGKPDSTLAFRLSTWRRDAQQLATCTGCYGSGADRHAESRACAVCRGSGRAAREPHVVELVDLVLELDGALLDERYARAEQADRATAAEHRAAALQLRVDAAAELVEGSSAMLGQLEAAVERARVAEHERDSLRDGVHELCGHRHGAGACIVATVAVVQRVERERDKAISECGRLRDELERVADERDAAREQVRQLHDDRRRLVGASVLEQQAGERNAVENAELRVELDRVRGELHRARNAEQRARQQGFDAGCELLRERVLALVVDGVTVEQLRGELSQAVRGES